MCHNFMGLRNHVLTVILGTAKRVHREKHKDYKSNRRKDRPNKEEQAD